MIMKAPNGGGSRRRPAANHPWNHAALRATAVPTSTDTRCKKVTMTVTTQELLNIRSRAGALSVSEFLRKHLPSEMFKPRLELQPPQPSESKTLEA